MTLKVWIKHDDIVETLIMGGDGRHTYNRLRGDVQRYAETKGWGKPTIVKVREMTGEKEYKELPEQRLPFIKELMQQGM
jgi:hypothetical protein